MTLNKIAFSSTGLFYIGLYAENSTFRNMNISNIEISNGYRSIGGIFGFEVSESIV